MKNIKPLLLILSLAFGGNLFAQGVEFENIQMINTEKLDFSPVPYGNGVIYTSSKSDRFLKCPSENAGEYTDMFYAEKSADGSFGEPKMLKGDVNGKYNDGVATFSPNGDMMIFTRNNMLGKNDSNIIYLKLYSVVLQDDGEWEEIAELPFNSEDWSTAHPTLSSDGSLLIFSSNRPGSRGMDLWGARMENGVWSIPFNLGPSVNTDKNEIFPFIDEMDNLFFSSNGHPGEGGLDIFAATNPSGGDEWDLAGNIGAPFNSALDEVAFVPMNGGTEGYLATDASRTNAKGMDDIYFWTRSSDLIDACIQVVDKETREPLPNAALAIDPGQYKNASFQKYGPVLDMLYKEEGSEIVMESKTIMTDENGMTTIRVYQGSQYAINASKEEYKPEDRNPTTEEMRVNDCYVIPLEREVFYCTLNVLVVEDPGGDPIPLADIKVLNKQTNEVVTLTGSGEGSASTQLNSDYDYEITASKRPYYDNTITLSNFKEECRVGLVKREVPLKKPNIVILEPIFYDFDRYYIRRRDARPTLDSLVQIMNRYPSLQVRLEAHTDARGPNRYNDILSQNRANSAKKYLVRKGIDDERIETQDFGETKPINECVDNVYCPEPAHQLNRRVDVTATRHQEGGIDFETRDVSEMNVVSDRQ